MRKLFSALLCIAGLCMYSSSLYAQPSEFSFGVIAPASSKLDETALRDMILKSDVDNLAFVVVDRIKSDDEACSDEVYKRRKALLNSAKNGLIVSLAASDWSGCKNAAGKSSAVERLNRVRDQFFSDDFSFGASKIPLVRQSASAKFRSYGENARWEFGNVMFATINLPANNNRYIADAGHNNEFEDRIIANRDWLQRIFVFATNKKADGIVLFCDGDPFSIPTSAQLSKLNGRRDGFLEVRRQINALVAKFTGKVLVIHGTKGTQPAITPQIAWRGNLGELVLSDEWTKLLVNPANATVFSVDVTPMEEKPSVKQQRSAADRSPKLGPVEKSD